MISLYHTRPAKLQCVVDELISMIPPIKNRLKPCVLKGCGLYLSQLQAETNKQFLTSNFGNSIVRLLKSEIHWRPFNLLACASPVHEHANAENGPVNLSSCSPRVHFPSGAASRRRGSASMANEAREPAATPVPAPRRAGLPVHFAAPEPHL